MEKRYNIIAAFFIMLCLGSIYAWSIFVPELIDTYGLTTAQTQLIFGTVISVFTLTMIGATALMQKLGPRILATISGLLYFIGYFIAFLSEGNFLYDGHGNVLSR
ncbi:hypothetical protein SAMN06265379_10919 [Saccharicrinis carchari]|uniref:Major facilitator superfamily (MFS) profile domain-containing protein n=1 Tax=Saccharicrinis carchari TaxID=1168039 RepID=A0A521EH31_SACCC|nr:OFA family MFS transporter [Saccharicrinis carchari]SMO83172.1 hypothetical protein SAMN06265379_10919 [Saccharicrinis carchari]